MKILVELPSWIGDTVMALPSIEKLFKRYPDAEFFFIGPLNTLELIRNHPKCSSIKKISRNYLRILIDSISYNKISLFVSFRSSFRTMFFKFFLNAEKKFQFNNKKLRAIHQVEKYNEFINDIVGSNTNPYETVIYFKKSASISLPKPTIGLNPGAAYGSAKCWTEEGFTEVAKYFSSAFDIVILGGTNELKVAQRIENKLIKSGVKNITNYAGKTSIQDLASIISGLKLFVTGDSGPMHIAASFKVPTVAIFGPTKFKETSPWGCQKSFIVQRNLPCQPCMKRVCPLKHHNCMELISSHDVSVVCNKALGGN